MHVSICQTLRLVPAAAEGTGDGAARLEIEDGARQEHHMLADMIGVAINGRELTVYAYPPTARRLCWMPLSSPGSSSSEGSSDKARPRRARHLRLVVETQEAAVGWKVAIEAELDSSGGGRARKLLVIVNPVSGRRKARHTYQTVVEPMLKQAGIEHQLMGAYGLSAVVFVVIQSKVAHQPSPRHIHAVTDRMLHAQEFVEKELVLSEWDGIVAVGGDGILYEIINGLARRDPTGLSALRQMPLAIIAGGTGNGLYASVLHHSAQAMSPVDATFLIIKGSLVQSDLSLIETAGGERHLSFLMLSWGLVADVDIESERIRWAGALRQDIYGVWAILRQKRYRGRLSFLPCPDPASASQGGGAQQPQQQSQQQPTALPPLAGPLPPDWVTIEDDFLMILISHVSHIAEKVHISPGKALGDGAFQLLVLRKPVSRGHLVNLFLSLEHGGHVSSDAVEVYSALAYRIEPLTEEGIYSLDGEVPEYGTIRGAIIPQAMRLMGALT